MAAGDATDAPPDPETQIQVAYFRAFTLMEPAEAYVFLNLHDWDFDAALASFHESTAVDADGPDPAPRPRPPAADDGAGSEDYVGGGDKDEDDEDYVGGSEDEDTALAAASAAVDERRRPAKRQKSSHQARGGSGGASGRGAVRTLSDLGGGKRAAGSDDDEVSDDDEWAPPPELYTGGEKRMVVRDQSKRKNVADEVYKQAKRKGAKPGPACRQTSSSRNFPGSDIVQSDAPQPPEEIVHNIYFWSNGFTVDDGPLRSFDDPEHASFLKSIKNSECPAELAPADGRSKVNVNLVRKEESCPEPVKRPAPFQGGGCTVIPDHPTGLALLDLFRRWVQGETIPWIHVASPYGSDPRALIANYSQVTSQKGHPAWYFVCIPQKKQGRDDRIKRTAGAGTWKEERKVALSEVSEGIGLEIGWKQSFSFVLKTRTAGEKKDTVTREGWIMHAVGLNDEEEPMGRCLCKVFPTPRKGNKIGKLVMDSAAAAMSLRAEATAEVTPPLAAAATAEVTPPLAAAATAKVTPPLAAAATAEVTPPLAAAAAATAEVTPPLAAAATAEVTPPLAAAATPTPTPPAPAPSASALMNAPAAATSAKKNATSQAATTSGNATTPATSDTSPPKKWVRVLISDSPTKSRDLSSAKRIYGVAEEEEGVAPPLKKMKLFDCRGWLTIEGAS